MLLFPEHPLVARPVTIGDSAIRFPKFKGNRYTPRIDIPFTLRPETW